MSAFVGKSPICSALLARAHYIESKYADKINENLENLILNGSVYREELEKTKKVIEVLKETDMISTVHLVDTVKIRSSNYDKFCEDFDLQSDWSIWDGYKIFEGRQIKTSYTLPERIISKNVGRYYIDIDSKDFDFLRKEFDEIIQAWKDFQYACLYSSRYNSFTLNGKVYDFEKERKDIEKYINTDRDKYFKLFDEFEKEKISETIEFLNLLNIDYRIFFENKKSDPSSYKYKKTVMNAKKNIYGIYTGSWRKKHLSDLNFSEYYKEIEKVS